MKVTKHPLYVLWAGMIARCENPNHVGYKNYGGRGIKVCERWRMSFENFLEDMGERPPGTTLDREDGNKDYEPGNCAWKTTAEQSRNTKRNVYIEVGGVRKTLRDWEIDSGVKRGAYQRRIDLGWDPVAAVTLPLQPGKPLRTREVSAA